MRGWKAKGWRTTTGEVKNVDLMKRLDELASRRDVRWTWVRGHAGDPLNDRADRLATQGRREARGIAPRPAPASVPGPASVPISAEAARRTTPVQIDLALGLEISRASKRAGITPTVFVEEAIRLALALGPEEAARLREKVKPAPVAAA
jgi:ribonuclease HI